MQKDTYSNLNLQTVWREKKKHTWSFSVLEVRIIAASTSGRVSLGRLSSSRLSFATTGTDISNIPTNCTYKMKFKKYAMRNILQMYITGLDGLDC